MTSPHTFRSAMAAFASGVTVITTTDEDAKPYGFTATSFCSVSLSPPLLLVCLAQTANCYPVFASCARFAVSMLRDGQDEVALRFATTRADKFGSGIVSRTPAGLPVIDSALCAIECSIQDRYDAGDHMLLLGRVDWVQFQNGAPLIYFNRAFHRLSSSTS
ncbi:flavin reductase family protein [Nonomuraea sp. SYSU D8015]|uniref:flavin reductase family protein n=1 Tax=Nonomuraea sp. SYSU D8015 TaxID=2593644 RepID=UPI00166182D4|nr:flavin reductase family protein [Nonomuraea sp. SYSU D8015]